MTKIIAKVGDTVVAESEKTVRVEGNYYFPPEDVRLDMFKTTETHTHCPWKGEASYYTISVNDQELVDAAWYYPETISEKAEPIKNYVAFWPNREVEISEA